MVRHQPSLESLLKRNRSYRGYDASRVVTEEDLLKILEVVPWVASGMNAQPLRFRLVTGADAARKQQDAQRDKQGFFHGYRV